MFNSHMTPQSIKINGHQLEQVDSYIYQGRMVNMNDDIMLEILNRCKIRWRAFSKMNAMFRSNMPISLKRKVFDQCILPVLTYSCEAWRLTAKANQKMKVTQRSMERQMLNLSCCDKKRNAWIRQETKIYDIMRRVVSRKWQWAGHVARRSGQRCISNTLNCLPRDHKGPSKRPKKRWIDDIVKYKGIKWRELTAQREG